MNQLKILESVFFTHSKNSILENQDSILAPIKTQKFLYMAIADGVGGNSGGAIAASAAIDAVKEAILVRPDQEIRNLFKAAQISVAELAARSKDKKKMATTLVVCKVSEQGIEIGSAGDSRAYFMRSGRLQLLTKDHTKKQELIDKGVFKENELEGHYSGSELTSFISSQDEFELDYKLLPFSSGAILLMTDGAYHFIDEEKIANRKHFGLISICSYIRESIKDPIDDFSLVAMEF